MAYVLCDPNKENVVGSEIKLAVDDTAKSKFAVDNYKIFDISDAEFDEIKKNKKIVKWSGDSYELLSPFPEGVTPLAYANAADVTEDLNREITDKENWVSTYLKSTDKDTVQSYINSIKPLTFDDLTFPHARGIADIIEAKGITYISTLQLK